MTDGNDLLASRKDSVKTLDSIKKVFAEDFDILLQFEAEVREVEWLSQSKILEGRKWRIAKNFSEAERFARTNLSSRYELDQLRKLDTELVSEKSEFYRAAINIFILDFIGIPEIPFSMYFSVDRCFFGVIAERILKKDKKEAKFNKIWKLYQYGHWPVRWNDDGVHIIY